MPITEDFTFPREKRDEYPAWIDFRVVRPPAVNPPELQASERQENQSIRGQTFVETGAGARLFLPTNLTYSGAVQYNNNARLGAGGTVLEAGLRNGDNLVTAAAKGFVDGIKSTYDAAVNGIDETNASRTAVGKLIPRVRNVSETAANALSSVTRLSDNPNIRTLFEEVPVRTFGFEFSLVPESRLEVDTIENIIDLFRSEMYPNALEVAAGLSFTYEFPNLFRIQPKYGETGEPIGKRFLEAYLTNCNVTYNNQGPAFFKDGKFTTYTLSMEFVEHRALSKRDVGPVRRNPNGPGTIGGY